MVRAPGRVNLIGDHTDYNDGFVLPMALPFDTVIASSASPDGATLVRSEGYGEALLGDDSPGWAAHARGTAEVMAADGVSSPPWRGAVASDIPTGAGLSSSAAIEVAVGLTIARRAGVSVPPERLAQYGQHVESRLLGAPSGIMDQLISATAEKGAASLIDCRTLAIRSAHLPTETVVVVMDTMTRRELVTSEFSARMRTCRRAAELLGVDSLRDVDDVSALRLSHDLEWRRSSHVVAENARTLAAFAAMEADDGPGLGRLMVDSHASLRDLFEVSGASLDTIVEVALTAPGCLGARMTGGGFAGCAVALVSTDSVEEFTTRVVVAHAQATGVSPTLWACDAAAGASSAGLE